MAPRFFASPYKNAVAQVGKIDTWWSELPVSTAAASDSANLIKTCSEYWLAQGKTSGSLVCLPYDQPGKFNQRAPSLQVAPRGITDFDLSRFDDLLAAGTDNGQILVHHLPGWDEFGDGSGSALAPQPALSVTHPSGRNIDTLSFHPTTSSLLLAGSGSVVAIYDIQAQSATPVFTLEQPKSVWSAKWSSDGRTITTTGKDGILRVFDVRDKTGKSSAETSIHAALKCSRHVWLDDDRVFTTGFNRMREREFALHDARSLGTPIKSQRLDNNMGALIPILDSSRNIVYLAGKGDMTLHWVEVGGPAMFTAGASPLPVAMASAALVQPSRLNLMKAEINHLVILSNDAVLPVPIEVPRRQYIDFHQDLFPPVAARVPAQDARAWRKGGDTAIKLETQNPNHQNRSNRQKNVAEALALTPVSAEQSRAEQETVADKTEISVSAESDFPIPTLEPRAQTTPRPRPPSPAAKSPSLTASPPRSKAKTTTSSRPTFGQKAKPTPSTAPVAPLTPALDTLKLDLEQKVQDATGQAPTPLHAPTETTAARTEQLKLQPARVAGAKASPAEKPANVKWSRAYLLGKTPMKPTYHVVHGLNATVGADTQMLKANSFHMFFPLSGAGGRLGVHPLAASGRLPTSIPSLVCGATIISFELDPFDPRRVFIASDDSKIRVFELPEGGLEADCGEIAAVLQDPGLDRIVELKHHPTARNTLLSISDDHGHPSARIWDHSAGSVLTSVALPKGGVSSAAWSPDGSRLALATKTKTVLVLDLRSPSSMMTTAAHDSIRPVRVCWTDDSHLLSTGFSRSASREIILYSIADGALSVVGKQMLDVSPAPLFPHVDLDTNVVFLYSRGDRSCHAYEIQPAQKPSPFTKLPSFETTTLQNGYAFMPKRMNDVKLVEIARALRLTASTVEVVTFTIPRSKTEYFQDDIFIPTRDVETPSLNAQEWIQGRDVLSKRLDLRPEGMMPLSEAPPAAAKVSTRSMIMEDGMTETQKTDAYMDRLFQSAKEGGDEELVRSKHTPVDDDW
ncbi:BZ3500_MvSof-1268-A1-R1_Chr3-1g05529 [Microbotryum saponariae]|uniref:BZ3500_MvSof-1268-A1-R1_Chr3-1g05529 protein n=1 Tax=Microbotryum saponariae TaxID=289078 RepID=A0A2X0N256_9BASI|nr:BZ3500_MvSof-1268-A1-R1_Chr3-1g05529 [Microbotryum saponariae]SDA04720.1 BZ3501_MvSof-1269-A2-R1_Chr3-1g05200 [Microbotryum saponariae]